LSSFSTGPSPTDLYTLSLHDALPILRDGGRDPGVEHRERGGHLGLLSQRGPIRGRRLRGARRGPGEDGNNGKSESVEGHGDALLVDGKRNGSLALNAARRTPAASRRRNAARTRASARSSMRPRASGAAPLRPPGRALASRIWL